MKSIGKNELVTILLESGLIDTLHTDILLDIGKEEYISTDDILDTLCAVYERVEESNITPYDTQFPDYEPEEMEILLFEELKADIIRLEQLNWIDSTIASLLATHIDEGMVAEKSDLFLIARNIIHYFYLLQPDNISSLIDSLYGVNLLDEKAYRYLQDRIRLYEIETLNDLLPHLSSTLPLNLYRTTGDKLGYLEEIHQQVADVLPELSFSAIQFQLIPAHLGREASYEQLRVTVEIDNRLYVYRSMAMLDRHDAKAPHIDSYRFFHLFNKALRDKQSPYRLFMITALNPLIPTLSPDYWIIALTLEQMNVVENSGITNGFLVLTPNEFDSSMDDSRIDEIVHRYCALGFFDHVNESDFEETLQQLYETSVYDSQKVVFAFPETFLTIGIMASHHGEWLMEAPKELTMQISKLTHGEFAPTNIDINFDEESNYLYSYRFTHGKKQYSIVDEADALQFIQRLVELVNTSLRDMAIPRQLYYLSTSSHTVQLVYATQEQYNSFCEDQLIEAETSTSAGEE